MEPAPVLVASLKIEVCRELEVTPPFKNGREANARVEPYIEDVLFFFEFASSAVRAFNPFRQKLIELLFKPDIGPFLLESVRELSDRPFVKERFPARDAVKGRYRHAPG